MYIDGSCIFNSTPRDCRIFSNIYRRYYIMNKIEALKWLVENAKHWPTATGGIASFPVGWSWGESPCGRLWLFRDIPTVGYNDCFIKRDEWLDGINEKTDKSVNSIVIQGRLFEMNESCDAIVITGDEDLAFLQSDNMKFNAKVVVTTCIGDRVTHCTCYICFTGSVKNMLYFELCDLADKSIGIL